MELFRHELRKIIEMPILWIFVAICVGFNIMLFISDVTYTDYIDYVGKTARQTGYRFNDKFYSELDKISASDLQYLNITPSDEEEYEKCQKAFYLSCLIEDTASPTDVFDNYDITAVADAYIEVYGITDEGIANALREKYRKTQPYVERLAETDNSLTLYFGSGPNGSATFDEFKNLFGGVMPAILMEGILIASLVALLSVGYEQMNSAELVVYSTRKGRNVLIPKLGVSLACGMGGYIIIAVITLSIYFITHDYTAIWNSSVSSLFNFVIDYAAGTRPFTTYGSFTIWQYLLAVVGISLLMIIFFSTMAFSLGMIQRNTYVAFGVLFVLNTCVVVAVTLLSMNNIIRYWLCNTPICLWIMESVWFTDGGENVLYTHFETFGILIWLAIIGAICFLLFKRFKRRNIL